MAISRMNMERQMRNMGGIMELEEPRQRFFLGKIVRKAKKAVKKVVKSPVGKAAILAGLGAYAGGLGPFASGSSMFGGKLAGLKGAGFLRGAGSGLFSGLTGGGDSFLGQIGNVFRIGGDADNKFSALRLLGGAAGLGAIAAPFLMGGEEEEVDEGVPVSGIQPMVADIRDQARKYYQDPTKSALYFMPPESVVQKRFLAEGGGLADIPREGYESGERVSGILKLLSRLTPFGAAKELASNMDIDDLKKLSMITPAGAGRKAAEGLAGMDMDILKRLSMFTPTGAAMQLGKKLAMKDGGMIDMGGLEKDYREGGFVPIGAEERADDVPARLSKNEFVFTADAVRNAGGGDIDKGAEVMQNMMDNLEAGGMISEESQGKENPAQAMFDQAQMLEGRLA